MEKKYRDGAAVLAGLAVVALVVTVLIDGDDPTPSCSLSTAAATVIVVGVSKGRATDEIVGPAAAGAIVPAFCKPVVQALVAEPDDKVTLDITTAGGTTQSVDVTGSDVLRPPGPVPQPTCSDWLLQTARDLCFQGRLGPPAPF